MGFGFLMYGFMMMLDYGVVVNLPYNIGLDVFPDLAGYLFMYAAMKRLEPYAGGFARMKSFLYPLFVIGCASLAGQLLAAADIGMSFVPQVLDAAELIKLPFQCLAFCCMFNGIKSLSAEVTLPKITRRANTALWLSFAMFTVRLLAEIQNRYSPLPMNAAVWNMVYYIAVFLWYVFVFFTLFVVFGCYMYICYEGEENMDTGSTTNPLVKLTEKFGKKK